MFLYVICSLLLLCVGHNAVTISIGATEALQALIHQFERNPLDSKYRMPFLPTSEEFSYPYHLLFFSPIDQFNVIVNCPDHGTPMRSSRWTCDLTNDCSRFNPRLLVCVNFNALLVQRYLSCSCGHECLPLSPNIVHILPSEVKLPPIRIYRRSAFTFRFINHIFEQLAQGLNFQSITETVANLHFIEYHERAQSNPFMEVENFYSDKLISYPVPDKIENIFLDVFTERKVLYDDAVFSRTPVTCLSADHTFKVGKNIGGYREVDHKFIKDSRQLFIMLDGTHSVLSWKLTKTGRFAEVKSCLEDVRDRLGSEKLSYILLDNCCDMAQLYRSVFADVIIKLDVFHAVQRLTKCLPDKHTTNSKKVASAIGLIFRDDDDMEETRFKPTPAPAVILQHLDIFLATHSWYFDKIPKKCKLSFLEAVDCLKRHINKGCLSHIEPGHGTEGNEGLHRLLNYSCLRGVSTIGTELALALLSLLFYVHNSRVNGRRHAFNSKIVPVKPLPQPRIFSDGKSSHNANKIDELHEIVHDELHVPSPDIAIFNQVYNRIIQVNKVLGVLSKNCRNRNFSPEDILNIRYLENDIPLGEADFGDNIVARNCLNFGLKVKEMPRDGDCLFRAILHQLSIYECDNSDLRNYWKDTLNLSLITATDSDVEILRKHFVVEMKTNDSYNAFKVDGDSDIDEYARRGVFASNLGDFVVSACSNILRVPIVIISSVRDLNIEPFFPNVVMSDSPMFIAYNNRECHYNSTEICSRDDRVLRADDCLKCSCQPRYGKTTCVNDGSSRCPCVQRNGKCSEKCRCKICGNGKTFMSIRKSCTCRSGDKDKGVKSCAVQNKKSTKCPCLKSGNGCSKECKCKNCGNEFGSRVVQIDTKVRQKRKEEIPTSYKKLRTTKFMELNKDQLNHGSWTRLESIALYCCVEFLNCDTKELSLENIHQLYLGVMKCDEEGLLQLRPKSSTQIKFKMFHML